MATPAGRVRLDGLTGDVQKDTGRAREDRAGDRILSRVRTVVGVDIGGSGIKGAPVDVGEGKLVSERIRLLTPSPATPDAVVAVVVDLLGQIGVPGPIGLTLPSVVRNGTVETAANIDPSWIGVDAAELFSRATGRAVGVLNDADAAGVAEMRFGAGRGEAGVVVLVTFGTGIGSALFVDGVLVPNTELGHLAPARRRRRSLGGRLRARARRPVVEGLRAPGAGLPRAGREPPVAQPVHHRRRRQQTRRRSSCRTSRSRPAWSPRSC